MVGDGGYGGEWWECRVVEDIMLDHVGNGGKLNVVFTRNRFSEASGSSGPSLSYMFNTPGRLPQQTGPRFVTPCFSLELRRRRELRRQQQNSGPRFVRHVFGFGRRCHEQRTNNNRRNKTGPRFVTHVLVLGGGGGGVANNGDNKNWT